MCRAHSKEDGDSSPRFQKEHRGQKLFDGKGVVGAQRLTQDMIKEPRTNMAWQ